MSHESSLSSVSAASTLDQLLSQITAGQPEASTVRIQIGRTVAYKGTAQQAQLNTLSPDQITELNDALAQSAGAFSQFKSTVSITVDGECCYRSSPKEGVTINQIGSQVGDRASEQTADSLEPVQPVVQTAPEAEIELTPAAASAPQPPQPVLVETDIPQPSAASAVEVSAPVEAVTAPSPSPVPPSGLSASDILMMEMHQPEVNLPDQTLQWVYSQFQEVAQSQLVQSLQKEGVQHTRTALAQLAKLPSATTEKGVADSLVALTKQFGGLQENADGSKQFKYEAENYSVTVRGTNHYTLSDKSGSTLFAFRHSPTGIQPTSPCKLSLSQRFEVMSAGTALVSTQVKEATRQGFSGLQTLASNLAQLAPKGTRERIVEVQQQQAVSVSEALVNTSQAINTAAGKMFTGSQFKVFKTPEALRVFATDGRGELLTKVGNTVKSRMNDLDLGHISKSAQTLANVFKSSQKQESRSSSGR